MVGAQVGAEVGGHVPYESAFSRLRYTLFHTVRAMSTRPYSHSSRIEIRVVWFSKCWQIVLSDTAVGPDAWSMRQYAMSLLPCINSVYQKMLITITHVIPGTSRNRATATPTICLHV